MNAYIERVLAETKAKNANEPEFLQTVEEVLSSLEPVINAHPEYEKACLLERMVEPERTIEFRVVWMDDNLQYHVNRGYRVQYNAALGPYKGGIRFDPDAATAAVTAVPITDPRLRTAWPETIYKITLHFQKMLKLELY